jgi:hypothetical protein
MLFLSITHGAKLPLQKLGDSRHALKFGPISISVHRDNMRRSIVLFFLRRSHQHLLNLRSKLQLFCLFVQFELPLEVQAFFLALDPFLVSLEGLLLRCRCLSVKVVR